MDYHAIAHYFSFKEQFAFVNDIDVGRAVSLYYILSDTHVQNFLYYIINRSFAKTLCFLRANAMWSRVTFCTKTESSFKGSKNFSQLFSKFFFFISRYVLYRFASFYCAKLSDSWNFLYSALLLRVYSQRLRAVIKRESYLFDIYVDILM